MFVCLLHFSDGCYINGGYYAGFGEVLNAKDGVVPVLKDAAYGVVAHASVFLSFGADFTYISLFFTLKQ